MKNIKLLIILFFFAISSLIAQDKKYIPYTVKRGETLKSISKELGIKTRDLKNLNPDVSRKPKVNTVIIIPNRNFRNVIDEVTDPSIHVVKPKETIYGISKKYNITKEALINANPSIKEGLKIGQKIKIPPLEEEIIAEEQLDENFHYHEVIKGDTFYNLGKRYEVTKESMLKLNPLLAEGLKLGMILKIEKKLDDISTEIDSLNIETESVFFIDKIQYGKSVNVALMLPFKLNDITNTYELFENENSLLNVVTDFYLGAEIAIDSLKSQGLDINLQVFDTQNSAYKVNAILASNDFENVDVVIGPLFLEKANLVAKKLDKGFVFTPSNKNGNTSSKLIKTSTDAKMLEETLIDYLLKNYLDENIILIGDAQQSTSTKIYSIASKLKSHDSITNIVTIRPDKGYINRDRIIEKINIDKNNWVIFIGDDHVVTFDVVNNLGSLPKEYNVQLFVLEKGANFDKMDNNQLGRLHFTYPSDEFVDNTSSTLKRFNQKYLQKNYALPSRYSYKGFDITYDALIRFASFDEFNDALKGGISQRLATKFNYNKKIFSSFQNTGVFLIEYQEDLNLKALD